MYTKRIEIFMKVLSQSVDSSGGIFCILVGVFTGVFRSEKSHGGLLLAPHE